MLSAQPKAKADNTYWGRLLIVLNTIHCFKLNNDKYTIPQNQFDTALSLEIIHCAHNLQISQLSASR